MRGEVSPSLQPWQAQAPACVRPADRPGGCLPGACVARPVRAGAPPAGPPCLGSLPLAAAALHVFRYPLGRGQSCAILTAG